MPKRAGDTSHPSKSGLGLYLRLQGATLRVRPLGGRSIMAECSFHIKRVPTNPDVTADKGGEEMFIPEPLGAGCIVEILLDGKPVRKPTGSMVSDIGDFDISGGSINHVILKPKRGQPKGKLEISVTCTDPACDKHTEHVDFNPDRSDAELKVLML